MNKSQHLITISEGYYGLNLSTPVLRKLQDQIDLPGRVDDLHVTLMYSKSTPALPKGLDLTGSLIVGTNPKYEKLGKYLTITFDSDYLQTLHQKVKELGEEHSFESYHPHVSLFKIGEDVEVDLGSLTELPSEIRMIVDSESINEVED